MPQKIISVKDVVHEEIMKHPDGITAATMAAIINNKNIFHMMTPGAISQTMKKLIKEGKVRAEQQKDVFRSSLFIPIIS